MEVLSIRTTVQNYCRNIATGPEIPDAEEIDQVCNCMRDSLGSFYADE